MTNQQKHFFMPTLETFYEKQIVRDEFSNKEDELWLFINKELNLKEDQRANLRELLFDIFEIVKWKYFEFGEMAHEMYEGVSDNCNPLDKFREKDIETI